MLQPRGKALYHALLLSYGATPTERHTGDDWRTDTNNWLRISPLHEAARKGDVSGARTLLQAGADLTARDDHIQSTPLAWAAKFGQLEMVKFLLQHGAPKRVPEQLTIRNGPRRWRGRSDAARGDRTAARVVAGCAHGTILFPT